MTDKSLELQIKIATAEAVAAVSSLKGELEAFASEAAKLTGSDGSSLAGTFAKAQEEAEKAAASFNLFGGSSAELRRVQGELKSAAIELVRNGIDPQSEEVKKLVEEYKKLEKAAGDIDEANGSNIDSFGKLKNTIMNLAEVAAALKALSVIKDMGAFALQTADNFQTARNQFGVLLGDMEAGAGLFNEIKAFNDVTPFDLDTLTQATNILISAKVPLQDLQAQLTKFGDLSQGNSQRMTSYVNAFSQAAAKGKADMQVLNTYLHQGVPILDELAKNFGVTTTEIVKMSSEGQISFADFSAALDGLTAAGGQYFGGMELASKSLAAMQEGLKEAVNSLAASFGDMLMPAAVGVTGILTDLTNYINESPIVKGIFAAAITAVTALMGAMAVKAAALAVKTWLAQAAQMGFNASLAVTNPLLWAGIAAAAAAAAGYVYYASKQQEAAKGAANLAYEQRKLNDAMKDGTNAVHEFYEQSKNFDFNAALFHINDLQKKVDGLNKTGISYGTDEEKNLRSAIERFKELRELFIKDFYDASTEEKIKELRERIEIAQTFKVTVGISEEGRAHLETIISDAKQEIERLGGDINKKAEKWKEDWSEVWEKFQAGANDPFFDIETERLKKLKEALANYVGEEDEAIRQINEYYNAKCREAIEQLAEEEGRIRRELSASKIDDLEYEKREAIRIINELEEKRIIAAAGSEEEILKIRERFENMRGDTEYKFRIEIEREKLDEARAAVKDWQQELSGSLALALMDIKGFSAQAAVVIGDLAGQLAAMGFEGLLSGLNAVGEALGKGGNAAENLRQALADMAGQILKQLPMMFLQAGLQLISSGQWPLGLGFIAAAGSSALISGYVNGRKEVSEHAHGGIFDEYGKAARAYAAGGAFTNQIVSSPTYFAHGGGLGLMGEAGPEAIMPLTRMPNGDLGVQTAGSTANVTVNIINNSGAEVHQEESEGADGGKQIDIIIGDMINRHLSSGKADRILNSRYGQRALGV